MELKKFSEAIEWLEHKTKPIFVVVALLLYAIELVRVAQDYNPVSQLDEFLVEALAALSVPFGVILLQELLELVSNMAESNLLSARRQFEIVVLVIVRSFFKNFAKVSDYVARPEFGTPVQESVVKIVAIMALMILIFFFRRMAESEHIRNYAAGKLSNAWKQILVTILIIVVLVNMLFVNGNFEEIEFIRLIFTGVIIIDAVFLLIAILRDSRFITIVFESSLIIALIFARFPLFTTSVLSVALSVLGVAFATGALYVMYQVVEILYARAEEMGISEEDITEIIEA